MKTILLTIVIALAAWVLIPSPFNFVAVVVVVTAAICTLN